MGGAAQARNKITKALDPLGAAVGRRYGPVAGSVAGPGGAVTGGVPGDPSNRSEADLPSIVEPPPPPIEPPTVMPVPGQDDLSNIAARRRSVREQLARRGRLSTILTQPQSQPLGG